VKSNPLISQLLGAQKCPTSGSVNNIITDPTTTTTTGTTGGAPTGTGDGTSSPTPTPTPTDSGLARLLNGLLGGDSG